MKRWFIDPRGGTLEISDCLQKGLLSEYYPLSFLRLAAQEREWTGQASTTQLINGTRLEYLKLTTDHAVSPEDEALPILGTLTHRKLEVFGDPGFTEQQLCQDDITGILDVLERQPNGDWWLVDYKTWGSWHVAKALGLVKKDRPAIDEQGHMVIYRSGARKGLPKMEGHFVVDPDEVDMEDTIWQLNRYRMMAEAHLNAPIKAMKVFAIVRDGKSWAAKKLGVDRRTYYLEVPYREDNIVELWFVFKKRKLTEALRLRKLPEPCSRWESWNGLRCRHFCPVAQACRAAGDNPYLNGREEMGQ